MKQFAYALLVASAGLSAQTNDRLLDLLNQHPLINSIRLDSSASQSAASSSRYRYPDPEIEISRTRGHENMFDLYPEVGANRRDITGSEVQIKQPLPFPGKGLIDASRLDTRAVAQSIRLRQTRNRLAREFLMQRIQEHLLDHKLDLSRLTLERLKSLETIAALRYESGKGSLVDLSAIRLRQSSTALTINEIQSEQTALKRAIEYFQPEASATPAITTEEIEALLLRLADVVTAEQTHLGDRSLDVQMARQIERDSDLADTLARMDYLPDFELFAAYGREKRTPLALRDYSDERTYKAGLTIRVPLWSAFGNHWAVSEKSDTLHAERFRVEDARRKAAADLAAALGRMKGISAGLRLHDSTLIPGAMSSHEAARINYASGRGDFASVIGTLETHLEHELSRIEHQREYDAELLRAAEILDVFFTEPGDHNEK